MPGGHNAAVVFPVEGGRAKVDQLHPGVRQCHRLPLCFLTSESEACLPGVPHPPQVALRGGAVLGAPVGGHKQDVLRLQVRVSEVVIVQELEKKGRLIFLHCCYIRWRTKDGSPPLSLQNFLREWLSFGIERLSV